jgi:hypothetical protein
VVVGWSITQKQFCAADVLVVVLPLRRILGFCM